jgi:hypothetical protein
MREFTVFYRLECGHGGTQEGWPGNEILCDKCNSMQVVTNAMEVPPWEAPA